MDTSISVNEDCALCGQHMFHFFLHCVQSLSFHFGVACSLYNCDFLPFCLRMAWTAKPARIKQYQTIIPR